MMVEFREDTVVWPKMLQLQACLCEQIEASGLPDVCECSIMVGALALDYCGSGSCGGQAWVRLSTAFPSTDFPNPQLTAANCYVPLVFELEIGIVRGKPVGTASGMRGYQPPTVQQQVDSVRLQTADIAAILRAINCCFANGDFNYSIGNYNPVNPEADCVGGAFLVQIQEEF
jgi:hypothetical protein